MLDDKSPPDSPARNHEEDEDEDEEEEAKGAEGLLAGNAAVPAVDLGCGQAEGEPWAPFSKGDAEDVRTREAAPREEPTALRDTGGGGGLLTRSGGVVVVVVVCAEHSDPIIARTSSVRTSGPREVRDERSEGVARGTLLGEGRLVGVWPIVRCLPRVVAD